MFDSSVPTYGVIRVRNYRFSPVDLHCYPQKSPSWRYAQEHTYVKHLTHTLFNIIFCSHLYFVLLMLFSPLGLALALYPCAFSFTLP